MPTTNIERRTIDVVPEHERHGTPRNQFTLWFGATTQITAVVDGALAVILGAHPLWAIVGVILGNVLGGAVMALHSAQGPKLGLPQMISSRAQFGVVGAALPLVMVILMYLGFAATGTVLSGQAINEILHVHTTWVGIVIFGLLTFVVAVFGYRWIHGLGRVSTGLCVLGFAWLTFRVLHGYDVPAMLSHNTFAAAPFLLAVSLGAGWQLTFGPYVADYSRYLPSTTPARRAFWSTFAGSVIGSSWAMTLGALVAAAAGGAFLKNQVAFVGQLAGGGVIAVGIYVVIVAGKLTVNTLNAYGGAMSMLTTVTGLSRGTVVRPAARLVCVFAFLASSVVVALAASADFLENFRNFILLLLMVFTPWSAINLVDFYLVSHEQVDVPALYDPAGRYGAFNVPALVIYVVGIVAQIPFLAQTLYTGPVTKALDGADISWIVGLVVTGLIYYVWAGRRGRVEAPVRTEETV